MVSRKMPMSVAKKNKIKGVRRRSIKIEQGHGHSGTAMGAHQTLATGLEAHSCLKGLCIL